MNSELQFWRAMVGYAVARAHAQRARAGQGRTELGASALEWAIISAILVAAAQSAGCRYLLSEDLQDGQSFDDLEIVNPFLHSPSP